MRSLVKFFSMFLYLLIIPSIIFSIVYKLALDEMVTIVAQFLVLGIFIISFFLYKKFEQDYEKKTVSMLETTDDIESLKELRKKRWSYKSKCEITKKIVDLDYDPAELENVKKYATCKDDMVFYYAKFVANDREEREEYKTRRDNFLKKYGKKTTIYFNFKENFHMAIKWGIVFFASSYLAYKNFYVNWFSTDLYELVRMVHFALNLLLAINSFIWIIRTTLSSWTKDYI